MNVLLLPQESPYKKYYEYKIILNLSLFQLLFIVMISMQSNIPLPSVVLAVIDHNGLSCMLVNNEFFFLIFCL